MSETQLAKKVVYVFDSAVPDIQKLIDAIGADQKIIILNTGSDGVLQLANALAGESNLDAIHLFSHGSVGSLSLGSTVLNESTLPNYSAALAQIGSALSSTGDLLLYGCNVAQGDQGQAFITQVAAATGADVAASADVTGAVSSGGNWLLEATSGTIDVKALDPSPLTFESTLGTSTSTITFSASHASLYGFSGQTNFNYTFDGLVIHPADIFASGRATADFPLTNATLALDYALSATNMTFGVPIDLGLSLGAFDLAYPINSTIVIPSTVKAGESYHIATGFTAGSAAQTTMAVDGPSANLSVKIVAEADISGHLALEWADVPFVSDNSVVLIGGEAAGGTGYTDSTAHLSVVQTLLDINNLDSLNPSHSLNNNLTWSENTLGGRFVYRNPLATLGFKLEPNGFDGTAQVANGAGGLFDLSTVLVQEDPMLSLEIDLDDLGGYLLERIPATAAAGALIRQLDHEYRAHYNVFGFDINSDYDASLLSVNASIGVSPAIKVEFDVQDVLVRLTTSYGETHTGHLGDLFSFNTPANAVNPVTVTASYSLVGDLKVSTGLVFTGGFEVKAIGADGQVFNLPIPAIFPDSASDPDSDPENFLVNKSVDWFSYEWFPGFASVTNAVEINAGGSTYSINVGQTTDNVGPVTNNASAPALSVSVVGASVNSQRQYSVIEGNSGDQAITFRVARSGDSSSAIIANYNFSFGAGLDRNDFANATLPVSGTVNFAAGDNSEDVTVLIHGDTLAESDEKLTLNLSSSAQVLTPSTVLFINSDDGYLVPVGLEMLGTARADVMIAGPQTQLVLGMAGNDTITANAGTIDGGSGFDVLTLDASLSPYALYSIVTPTTGPVQSFYNTSDFDGLRSALAQSGASLSISDPGRGTAAITNIEQFNVIGTSNANFNGWNGDLLIYQGTGGSYRGGRSSHV